MQKIKPNPNSSKMLFFNRPGGFLKRSGIDRVVKNRQSDVLITSSTIARIIEELGRSVSILVEIGWRPMRFKSIGCGH
jgi:hypothetical protein